MQLNVTFSYLLLVSVDSMSLFDKKHRHLSNIDYWRVPLALFAPLVLLMAGAKKEALQDWR
jgi:hypothetical protein